MPFTTGAGEAMDGEPAAKRGCSPVTVVVQLGLAGRTVALQVPSALKVSDLRARIALASPDFEHETCQPWEG